MVPHSFLCWPMIVLRVEREYSLEYLSSTLYYRMTGSLFDQVIDVPVWQDELTWDLQGGQRLIGFKKVEHFCVCFGSGMWINCW